MANMVLTASGIKDKKQKRALLLYQAGSRVREIFRQLADTGPDDDYDTAKAKFNEHFEPQKNRRYEVFKFREAKQEPSETLDQFTLVCDHLPRRAHSPMQILKLSSK